MLKATIKVSLSLSLSLSLSVSDIGLGVRVFANGPGDLGSIPGRVIPKTQKMVLDASLLNTQHYKVRIKGKVEQSREGVAPSPTPWCSSYRKGSLRVTLDYGRQLYFYIYICVCVCINLILLCPVGWGCRIHWLHLCRGVKKTKKKNKKTRVSWIWHKAIWWWGSSNAGALGNTEYPFIAVAPRSTLARLGSTW